MVAFWGVLPLIGLCVGFTLDAQTPMLKKGSPGSYFGFSVTQHSPVTEKPNPSILVGAPLDQNLETGAQRLGAIWQCPITMLPDDCIQIPLDGKVSGSSANLQPPRSSENKTDQWLGVTVSSQGGNVIACAHRYIIDTETGLGQGRCFTLTPGLELDEVLEPCRGRPTTRPLEEYGFCQVGTSSMMLGKWGIMGSPGPLTARGTAFLVDTTQDFLLRDKTVYHAPVNPSPVDKYSYLGMTVTGFESDVGPVVVAGAPRAFDGKGAVFLFTLEQASNPILRSVVQLEGEQQSFSNFGYEVAIADVNGDKQKDILVGSPEYFEEDKIGGAVFLFLSKGLLEWETPLKLTGGGFESRFGLAISTCGDLNKDGFEDFAVGAPYDNDGEGKIFIFLGSPDREKIVPSQVLLGSRYGLRWLGLSLSGGRDLDGNGMPDLAAGAEAAVALFRGRRLLPLDVKIGPPGALSNIDTTGCSESFTTDPCFRIQACVSINFTQELTLYYTLKGDIRLPLPRVWFFGSDTLTVKKGKISLKPEADSSSASYCSNYTVFIRRSQRHLRKPIRFQMTYTLPDVQGPIIAEGPDLPQLEPQLDPTMAIREFEATFSKDCGQVCLSDLQIDSEINLPRGKGDYFFMVIGEDAEVKLEVSVINLGMNAYEAVLIVDYAKELSFIGISANSTNQRIKAVNNSVICELGDPMEKQEVSYISLRFSLKFVTEPGRLLAFKLSTNTSSEKAKPTSPELVYIRSFFRYDPPTITGRSLPEQIANSGQFEEEVQTLEQFGLKVDHVYNVSNQAERAIQLMELNIDWPHSYRSPPVDDSPPIQKILLYITETPSVVGAKGQCTTVEGQVNPLNIPEILDDETSGTDSRKIEENSRRRRSPEQQKTQVKRKITVNCGEGHYCLHIHCSIEDLQPGEQASIFIRARISNKTLVHMSSEVKEISIFSRALLTLTVPEDVFIGKKPTSFMLNAQTIVLLQWKDLKDKGMKYWVVILISIMLGVFILGIIIVLLRFCGFFKRDEISDEIDANYEESEVLKDEKME